MKRHKHSLSHFRLLTGDMGLLLPIACYDVLPGDTIDQSSSCLMRLSPLATPVMHPVSVRIHHWFCPKRLLWDGWEDFITGGNDGEGGSAGTYPTISAGGSGFTAGELADYLGIPPGVANLSVSAFGFRAYNKIFNEYYRDQDYVTEVAEDSTVIQEIAWEKDYFTAARDFPQRGPDITLPIGTSAPIVFDATQEGESRWRNVTTNATNENVASSNWGLQGGQQANTSSNEKYDFVPGDTLYADLSNATAVNINDVREAFALQRYAEARARYGARFTEYLRYLGVTPSDARLQRPEYLGGGKQTIAFSEVLQTGPDSEDAGVANLKGHGIAALRSNRYRKFIEEHGVILSLLSVRPKTMYSNSMHRMWSKRTKEDYWQRELERIGQQEIYRREVYAQSDANGGDTIFGYGDRYAEYRSHPSTVHGEFRSTLNSWHLSRQFGSAPALNADFIGCDPSKRIFQVQTNDVLWMMVQNNIRARRLVTRSPASGIY